MGDYFTKHNTPHHHKKILATHLYMASVLLKIDQNIVQKWANAVLTPIHTAEVTPVHTVEISKTALFCKGVLMSYIRTDTKIPNQ